MKPSYRVEEYLSGWDAWITLPGKPEVKIGECYISKNSAIAACKRAIKKYSPVFPEARP